MFREKAMAGCIEERMLQAKLSSVHGIHQKSSLSEAAAGLNFLSAVSKMNRGAIWVGDERGRLFPKQLYWSLHQVQSFYFTCYFCGKHVNDMPERSPVSLHLEGEFSFCCVKYCRLILRKTFQNW